MIRMSKPVDQTPRPLADRAAKPSLLVKFLTALAASALAAMANVSVANVHEPHENIMAAATQAVLAMPEVQSLVNPAITPNNLDDRLRLTRCDQPLSGTVTSRYMRGGRLTVDIACNGVQPWSIYVPVTLTSEIQVVTLLQALPRDAVVTEADVDVMTLRRRPNGLPTISDPHQAVGMALKRALSEGTEITPTMLKQPVVIKRGDQTLITAGGGGLSVRMSGKALEDGVIGEQIRVQNLSSRRTVQGEVQPDGSISVSY